jgi:hypothetical protein
MSELLQFIIVIAFGGLCFGVGYLIKRSRPMQPEERTHDSSAHSALAHFAFGAWI